MTFLRENLSRLNQQLKDCCAEAGREPRSVTLLAVTKRQPLEKLHAAYQLGLRCFGENQVQEMNRKAAELPGDIEWHLIGPLQSNKVRAALQHAAVIHSVDSLKLLERLERIAGEEGKKPRIFLQVNLTNETQKSGFQRQTLVKAVEFAVKCNNLQLIGLMTMGAASASCEENRAIFKELCNLRNFLQKTAPKLTELSMGMSGDFPVAVSEGSTLVRIGSLLLGERNY